MTGGGKNTRERGVYRYSAAASCHNRPLERKLLKPFVHLSAVIPHIESGRVLLTPGLRLARQLTQAWVKQALTEKEVIAEPVIQPVDAWLEARWLEAVERGLLPAQRMLSKLEERLLWQQIVEEDHRDSNDFRLLKPSAAAEQARLSREKLLQFAPKGDDSGWRSLFQYDADCRAFARWCKRFDALMQRSCWTTRVDAYRQLLTLPDPQKVSLTLCHCLHLSPLTEQALAHLGNIERIGTPPEQAAHDGTQLPSQHFDDRSLELAAVARWAVQRHHEAQESTGIVLMDIKADRPLLEYFLRQEFDCLDARYNSLPVNFSTGMPLAQTPMYRDALLALSLDVLPLTRARALQLVRSPYLMGVDFAESISGLNLAAVLLDFAVDPIPLEDFQHAVNQCVPQSNLALVLAAWRSDRVRHSRKQDLYQWCDYLRGELEMWGWPARNALDSVEYQQLDRFDRSLDLLAGLGATHGSVDFRRVVTLWAQCLEDLIFQPKTHSGDLQVMGPLEAIGLRFDVLWVCGLQAGTLPSRPRLLPFIPGVLQRDWGMPDADNRQLIDQAQTLVASWQATHKSVIGSCRGLVDGVEQQPSPLITVETTHTETRLQRPSHWQDSVTLEQINEPTALPLSEAPAIAYGGGASVLKNQSACPFRAWVTHRLGPSTIESPRLGLSAAERGSIVHDALYYVWGKLESGAGLAASDDQTLAAIISDAVDNALREIEQKSRRHGIAVRKRVGSACLEIEAERCKKLVSEWLDQERNRSDNFRVAEREESHELTVGPLVLTLRPDRVDELADGRRIVIDYKTGSVAVSSWLSDRPADPQLPLYVMLDERVSGLSFARVRRGESKFVFLGEELGLKAGDKGLAAQLKSSRAEVLSWDELAVKWRESLTVLATDYAEGDARVDPLRGACLYCDLSSVCRIAERHEEIEA